MDRIKLNILGISGKKTQSDAYVLVLEDEQRMIRVPVVIRMQEAESIALELEGLKTPRPLTHDLMTNFSNAFNIRVSEVEIYKVEDGVFYANILFVGQNNTIKIDARLSDAVALALRFNAPIYSKKEIIEKAGISFLDQDKKIIEPEKDVINNEIKIKELQKKLEKAITEENYELAAKLKKELDQLK